MATPRVLVFDSDPSSLGLLTHGMNRFGLATDGASDTKQAISLMMSNRPDVVVSDMDAGAGFKFLESIRQNPETRDVPVLLLAKGPWARHRAQARELGAQELVAKPAFVQDIAVLTWLYAGHSANEEWFEGSFGEPSCAALLRGLLAGGRSGTLRLEPSDAIVRFRDGAVVDAALPPLIGERALLRILTLGTGSYELTFGPLPVQPTMQFELADLATRGLAHVRLWDQLKHEIQPLDQVLTVDFENLSTRVASLPRGLFGLIRLFDGKRTIGDVIAASSLDDLTAGQAIAKLRSLNVFEQGRRNKWEADTPALGRPTPLEVVPAVVEATDDLPPLASETAAQDLAPALLTSAVAVEAAPSIDAHAAFEREFFATPDEVIHAEHRLQHEPARAPSPVRVLGWTLVGATLVAAAILFWRSTPSEVNTSAAVEPVAAPPSIGPVAVSAPAVVAAPVAAPQPVAPVGLSDASKKFDHLMSDGALAYDRENFKQALDVFQQAHALLPENPTAAVAVGETQYVLGKLDAATVTLTDAVKTNPNNGRAEILLGAIAQERGQKDLARDHYQNYLTLDPDGETAGEVKELLQTLGK